MKNQILIHSADISRSKAFYQSLFDAEPVALSDETIWFEVHDPDLYLTIRKGEPNGPANRRRGVVWLEAGRFLTTAWDRLSASGLIVEDEGKVGCFYPSSSRLWVRDPDGNRWNFFVPELPLTNGLQEERLFIILGNRGFFFPDSPGWEATGPSERLERRSDDAS